MAESVAYSEREPSTLDIISRTHKAEKILAVLTDYVSCDEMGTWQCLDVGSSGGVIAGFLGTHVRQVVGIDPDAKAIRFAQQHSRRSNVAFALGSACRVPFSKELFDLVICNHVYEHVPNTQALVDEVFRVLRPGGLCYLACTNKYWLLEPHYRLPFLSWMPKPAADLYLRLTRRGRKYTEQLLSRSQILRLLDRFHVTDYTIRILQSPQAFKATDVLQRFPLAPKLPLPLARLLLPVMPTFVWIAEKAKSL